ncbi:MAG: hypothetical protein ACRC2T_13600 [Thermoguttaceae bacterium]
MIFASIDIGSNAGRLLIANVFQTNNGLRTGELAFVRVPLRLGQDVFQDGFVSHHRVEMLLKTMQAYRLIMDVYEPATYRACATAAMREAENRDEIVKKIHKETGIHLDVITGLEEATIIRDSNNWVHPESVDTLMYVDVGGGSTEISFLKDHTFVNSQSFNIGTIRLLGNSVKKDEFQNMEHWLKESSKSLGTILAVGSGGNINKLAKLFGESGGAGLTFAQLNDGYKTLKKTTLQERIEKMGMKPDRADVIIPAAKIFVKIMEAANCHRILAPKVGLADGLIFQLYNNLNAGQKE